MTTTTKLVSVESVVAAIEQWMCRDGIEGYDVLIAAIESLPAANGWPSGARQFIGRVSKQRPEKPDYWNSCSQCERNRDDAEEIIDSAPPTDPKTEIEGAL